MFLPTNTLLDKKKTFIFIFIQNITAKNMQDLIFFLKKNNFDIQRITRKNNKQVLTSIFVNANFISNSEQNISTYQLETVLKFLNKNAKVHGVFFKNQVLNLERFNQIETPFLFNFWKQFQNLTF